MPVKSVDFTDEKFYSATIQAPEGYVVKGPSTQTIIYNGKSK